MSNQSRERSGWANQKRRKLYRVARSGYIAARNYLDPASKLNSPDRLEVARLQLSDLITRTPYWLAVIADACIIIWAFATKDTAKSSWRMTLWTTGLVAVMILYPFLLKWAKRLPEQASKQDIKRVHLVWCAWLTIVAAVWLAGNAVVANQPMPYGARFELAQQTFVYLTILGQFITVMCFAPSSLAIFGVIGLANLLPFEAHIMQSLRDHNPGLSLVNTHIFFTGQLVMFLIAGWFFSISQKRFYIRQVELRREKALSEVERARAEAERLRANNFITAVGHDLKQPLQATALKLNTLRKKAAASPDLFETIDELERQNMSIHEMVEASFDLSRLNAGTWNVEVREAVLSSVILSVLDEFNYHASQKGITLESEPVPPVLVRTDPDALARILRNLVSNAIKYTPASSAGEPGRVAISYRQEGTHFLIDVADNGIGIPAERAKDIFEPYVQLGNPARDRKKGFGLGLSIVDRLIKLLDGHSISLSQAGERGSLFTVSLPYVARIPEELLQQQHGNTESPNLIGMKIIVIEDVTALRDAVCEQLIDLGCLVYDGGSVEEVLQGMRENNDDMDSPHFIVADYRLAEGIEAGAYTGVDVIKSLRRKFNNDVPAIIWTAETDPGLLQQIAVEGLDVISKGPRMFDELLNMLRRRHQELKAPNDAAA